ncbi:hypothetical protein KLER11_gp61 [Pararheinheimera phage vB_PsoM_KLER1-1]|nr:hypothetical protein KLER11_gp61 [Pararheinheimera phage vB_PsoM_KLER1-1]
MIWPTLLPMAAGFICLLIAGLAWFDELFKREHRTMIAVIFFIAAALIYGFGLYFSYQFHVG